MSSSDKDEKAADCAEEKALSCSMTFQNAIEIDYSKLREMAKTEERVQVQSSECVSGHADEESLSAPVLSSSVAPSTARDLSVYDRPSTASHDPDSSSDEENDDEDEGGRRNEEDEPETEVENSGEEEEEEDISLQYEQLGSTEFTKAHSDDENEGGGEEGGSDGEFGDFESCPVSYQTMSDDNDSSSSSDNKGITAEMSVSCSGRNSNRNRDREVVDIDTREVVDTTQDVLGSQHPPRTPARAIPPLDQAKIALIKQTMAGISLKPPGGSGAARVADAVIKAKPRVGDELKQT